MSEELEDFEDYADPIAAVMNEAEGVTFRGASLMLSDSAVTAAQAFGLKLFNLDEDKLLDSTNVYEGQISDAVITIFCSLCTTGEIPEGTPNEKKWRKILKRKTLGAIMLKPYRFEEIVADFADDFGLTQDLEETFEVFNELWGQPFKTDVTLKGGGDEEPPGKSQSPQPSESLSPAKPSELTTTPPATESQPQP